MWMASGASSHGHNPGHGGPHVRLEEVAEPLGRVVASLRVDLDSADVLVG